ncbi:portal protein [Mycobacterium phage Rope]|uniref:Portal protein n=1 Tax=Mycobacterium phage Rope TaxID=2767563 RepID=A0A7G9V062_9CAUD|nr:portal protein [Mycobacterium phage Rope]
MPYIPKQYDSAIAFLKGYGNLLGNIVDPMDQARVKAYNLYDDFYHNRPETFQVTVRGSSDVEIYLPSTKKIIDSTARFLAVKFDWNLKGGNASELRQYFDNLNKREELQRKFVTAKKAGLTRGDAIWHITADPSKQRGTRISIHTMHPSCYFPIEDGDRVIGCHLVDLVPDPRESTAAYPDRSKLVARRQTYRKEDGGITSEARLFELGGWDDRNLKPDELKPLQGVKILMPKKLLPKQIQTIPVYHIPNNVPDGSTWGTSQVAGIEYIINALNQSTTYEDLSLVLQGLGVYVSSAGPPTGPDGKPGEYKLHPGNVLEIGQDDTFQRVTGVASVTPFQEHMQWMDDYAAKGLGLPDMASGKVDVSVAQSGIALALEMGPIISENEDKQLTIGGKWDQIGHDLIQGWLPAFEELESNGTVWETVFGDPMPVNRESKIEELVTLKTAGLLLIDEVRQEMEKLGYEYKPGITEKLLAEARAIADTAMGNTSGEADAGVDDFSDIGTLNGSQLAFEV